MPVHNCSYALIIPLQRSAFCTIDSLVLAFRLTINSVQWCRCNLVDLMVEMDRILRPEGTVVVRDSPHVLEKVNRVAGAVRWTTSIHNPEPESNSEEKILVATKTFWKAVH